MSIVKAWAEFTLEAACCTPRTPPARTAARLRPVAGPHGTWCTGDSHARRSPARAAGAGRPWPRRPESHRDRPTKSRCSAWHDQDNGILLLPRRNLVLFALRLQLCPPGLRGAGVGVRDDDEVGPLPSAEGLQLSGIPRSHPLLARLASGRKRECRDIARAELSPLEEPPQERIGLRVLAQQRDVDSTHSRSRPRIIASDSEMPSAVRSGLSLTRTGPFASR